MGELQELTNHFLENPEAREHELARLASEEARELVCSVEAFYKRVCDISAGRLTRYFSLDSCYLHV